MTQLDFAALGLAEPLVRALKSAGLVTPTPIQAEAIPALLDDYDMLGIAQTGTGKTAAFALPILQHLDEDRVRLPAKAVRALILAPTRELAIQIDAAIRSYGRHLRLRHALVFGGVGHAPQVKALAQGVEILVATPGRLLDLLDRRQVRLDHVTHLVLDEADRMLDMGFVRDVMRIVRALPIERQSLLFSATMPPEVAKLAEEILWEPVRVEVTPERVTVEAIEQRVFHVAAGEKRDLLSTLLADPALGRVVVFTRTKRGADRVAEHLERTGVAADALHGNKSQNARQRALDGFRRGEVRVLVATDIAARGIDVAEVSHVINFEVPNEPESYVHRIGRTGRAGRAGIALSFCDPSERAYLKAIERLTRQTIPVAHAEGVRSAEALPEEKPKPRNQRSASRNRGGYQGQRRRAA